MDCRHRGEFAVRWDYLNEDEASGTGWIVCRECQALLDRFSVAGGRFRGHGRHLAAFQDQIPSEDTFAALRDLEID
jgi:hypothetical protein